MATHLSKAVEEPRVRTFLAIELPAREKSRLAELERDFAEHRSVLKWVAPDLLHITLRFLGGVPAPNLPSIFDAATRSALALEPFVLRLSGLGAFPHVQTPKVVWVGLERDAGFTALESLFQRLDAELAAYGFPREERAFSPHITLGRVRESASGADRRRIGEMLAKVGERRQVRGSFWVTNLVIMRSDLSRTGSVYTPMAVAPLSR
jgi:2'-5' RNA ligase